MTAWLLIVAGLVLLVAGAELFVRGAAGLATRLRVSPLLIGLTVVSFGTSAPEVAVSLSAVFKDSPALAVGNAVGSNIFNTLVILGLSALVAPLVVAVKLIRVDIPIMIGVSILLWLLALDGQLGRLDGAILFSGIILYTGMAIRASKRARRDSPDQIPESDSAEMTPKPGALIAFGVSGFIGLLLGARWLVDGSVTVAASLGVSELVIGLTIVAAGTSLPEAATSIVAAMRGHRDIAVGNVVGSNIFNILCILGLAGLAAPSGLPVLAGALAFDIPVMVAVSVLCLPIVFTGRAVSRWEGGLFVCFYLAYLLRLVLDSSDHGSLEGFDRVMLWFVLPIAGVGVAGTVAASLRSGRAGAEV